MHKVLLVSLFLIQLINPIFPTHFKNENSRKFLHVYDEHSELKPKLIKNTNQDLQEAIHRRFARDLTATDRNEEGIKNITTKVNNFFCMCIMRHFRNLT